MKSVLTTYNAISNILQKRADLNPNKIAYTFLKDGGNIEEKVTYLDLHLSAIKIARRLHECCKKSDRVVMFFPPGLEFIKAFFGCLYAGVIAVPSYPPKKNRYNEKLKLIIHDCKPQAIITISQAGFDRAIKMININNVPVINIEELSDQNSIKPSILSSEDVAFIQYTSGSTGNPKGVMVTHGNLFYNEILIQKAFALSEESIAVGWLPFYHDMGLIGNILQPIFTGFESVLMSPVHFLQKPARWLRAISKYNATVSGGPNFAFNLCVEKILQEEIKDINLECWEVAFNGAEPVRANTMDNFYNKFKSVGFKKNAFLPCYGMAETTLLVSGVEPEKLPTCENFNLKDLQYYKDDFSEKLSGDTIEIVSCGICNNYNIALVDEAGNECKPGKVGELWLQGESVAKGYWNKDLETKEVFGGKLNSRNGKYLKTGDLAIIRNNEIFIVGRVKDLIIINGKNYYPQDIEFHVAQSSKKIVKDAVAAFGIQVGQDEKLVIVAEVEYEKSLDTISIQNSVNKTFITEFEFTPYDIILLRKGTIPKTTSGKIQRNVCKADYQNGNLREVGLTISGEIDSIISSRYNFTQKETEIYSLLKKEYKSEISSKDTDLFSIGLDSIQLTRFTYRLSDFYQKDITADFILDNNTIKKIAENLDSIEQAISIERKHENKAAPVTGLQELIWFNQQRNPANTGYNIPVILDFDTDINIDALNKTIYFLIARHSVYRTNFQLINGKLFQIENEPESFFIDTRDLSQLNKEEFHVQYSSIIKKKATHHFDLQNDRLIQFLALIKPGNKFSLLFVIHHIIVDGASVAMLLKEFKNIYQMVGYKGKLPNYSDGISFSDFTDYYSLRINEPDMQQKKEFWLKQFKEEIKPIRLPFYYSKDLELNKEGSSFYFEIDGGLFAELNHALSKTKINQYTYLLSAYYLLLHHLTGENDLIIGAPVSLRKRKELQEMHGLLINTSMLRMKIDKNFSLIQFAGKVYNFTREVLQNADYPFNRLLRDLEIPLGENQLAITSIFFNYLDFTYERESDVVFNMFRSDLGVDLNFDLNLYALPGRSNIKFRLDFCKYHLNFESAEIIAELYIRILSELIKYPNKTIAEINNILPEKINTISPVNSFEPFSEKDLDLSIINKFRNIALQYPQRIAIKTNEEVITYSDLDALSNNIAKQLNIKSNHNEPFAVGLLFGHELNMIYSILAVLKTGNYYVPLDNEYPFDRLCYILNDAEIKCILTNRQYYSKALEICKITAKDTLIINIDEENISSLFDNSKITISKKSLAYILYTSGSTGTPKGVMQTHEYVMHLTYSFTNSLHIAKEDCFTLIPSFNFSASVMDLFGVLLNGASLYLVDIKKGGITDLLKGMKRFNITVYHSVPTVFRAVCEELNAHNVSHVADMKPTNCSIQSVSYNLKSLRLIYLAGEPLLKNDFESYKKHFHDNVILVNGLGCTEFNICRQYFISKMTNIRTSTVPIGYKAIGADVLIVDENRSVLNNFQPGEIAIKSKYLSKGYWGSPELTEKKFTVVETETDERIYYTGDLGQKTIDGCLFHLGRKDFQVKIRGQRVELAEIESAFLKIGGIKRAIVVLQTIGKTDCLCGYFIADQDFDREYLKDKLESMLPSYMVPEYNLRLKDFPLTDTGKVDRKNLPIPEFSKKDDEILRSNTENTVAEIWAKVLGIDYKMLSPNSNFFEIGGHSLRAIQLIQEINKKFEYNLTIKDIFQLRTIRAITNHLEVSNSSNNIKNCIVNESVNEFNNQPNNVDGYKNFDLNNQIKHIEASNQLKYISIPKYDKKEYYSLSPSQRRLFYFQQLNKGSVAYNMTNIVEIKGNLDILKLQNAINKLIRRHSIFESSVKLYKNEPVLYINREVKIELKISRNRQSYANLVNDFVKPFNLEKDPLFKVSLYINSIGHYYLLMDMHHIISDGVSMSIIVKEIFLFYNDEEPEPLKIEFFDYLEWLRGDAHSKIITKSVRFWESYLRNMDNYRLRLPYDYSFKDKDSFEGDNVYFEFDTQQTTEIKKIANKYCVTEFSVLLSFYYILLFRVCEEQQDIIIGTGVSGRTHADVINLIGFFVNTIPIRQNISNSQSIADLIKAVQHSNAEIFENSNYPFEAITEKFQKMNKDVDDLISAVFVLQNMDFGEYFNDLKYHGMSISLVNEKPKISKFDLTFYSIEINRKYKFRVEYKTKLFKKSTIMALIDIYKEIFEKIRKEGESILIKALFNKEESINMDSEYNDYSFNL